MLFSCQVCAITKRGSYPVSQVRLLRWPFWPTPYSSPLDCDLWDMQPLPVHPAGYTAEMLGSFLLAATTAPMFAVQRRTGLTPAVFDSCASDPRGYGSGQPFPRLTICGSGTARPYMVTAMELGFSGKASATGKLPSLTRRKKQQLAPPQDSSANGASHTPDRESSASRICRRPPYRRKGRDQGRLPVGWPPLFLAFRYFLLDVG